MGANCVNCKKFEKSAPEILTTANETNENSEFTLLKGHYLINGQKICNFVNYNYRRLYSKLKYNKMINKLQNIFCVESIYFPKKKNYYETLLNNKLKNFFDNKEDILEKIYEEEKIFLELHDFEGLKNMIKEYYANDICSNNINFYNDFSEYVKDKKNLKQLIEKKRSAQNQNVNPIKLKQSIKKLITIQKLIYKKNTDSLLDSQINFIKKDIENLYNLCLNVSEEELPEKIDDITNSNKSYLLMLLNDELKSNSQIFLYGKLRIFIKSLYYIYLLKKYNFLSSTYNNYYKIGKDEFDSIINNKKYYLKVNDIEKFKKIRKKKISNCFKNKNNIFNFDEKSVEIDENENLEEINRKNKEFHQREKSNRELSYISLNNENNSLNKINSKEKKKPKKIQSMLRLPSMKYSPNRKKIKISNVKNKYSYFNLNKEEKSFFRRKLRGKTSHNIAYVNNNKEETFINIIDYDNSRNNYFETKTEFYEGQYDNTLYLYAGFGTLIKQRNRSLYYGTFRYGKKEGLGIYYRQFSEYHFKYYKGEFTRNKFDGFGLLIELNFRYAKIMKGIFHNSHFISGQIVIFNENNNINLLEITKYEGDLEENLSGVIIYKNYGHLIKMTYCFNENLSKYELESEYDYTGYFIGGKEEGKGTLKNILKTEGYSYEYKGNFVNGEINGYGIINYSDNYFIKKYEGFFHLGVNFSKYGIVYFKSGDVYEGFFDDKHFKDFCGLYMYNNNNTEENNNGNNHIRNDNYFGGYEEDKKSGFGRYISYSDNLTKLLMGNYLNGEKNGLFNLVFEEEDESLKKQQVIKVNDITSAITNLFSGIPVINNYKFVVQRKNYLMFETGQLIEKSDKPIV